MNKVILFFILVLVTSCKADDKPAGLLSPKKMQVVLWDMIKADAYTKGFIKNDTAKNAEAENRKLQQQVFAIHGVSEKDFYSSYDYYKKNTPAFRIILDSISIMAQRNKYMKSNPIPAN